MDSRRFVARFAQQFRYGAPDLALSVRLLTVQPALKHSQDHVVFADKEPLDLCLLAIVELRAIRSCCAGVLYGGLRKDFVDTLVEFLVDAAYQFSEVRQPCRARDARTTDEQYLATCVCQQQTFRYCRQVRGE